LKRTLQSLSFLFCLAFLFNACSRNVDKEPNCEYIWQSPMKDTVSGTELWLNYEICDDFPQGMDFREALVYLVNPAFSKTDTVGIPRTLGGETRTLNVLGAYHPEFKLQHLESAAGRNLLMVKKHNVYGDEEFEEKPLKNERRSFWVFDLETNKCMFYRMDYYWASHHVQEKEDEESGKYRADATSTVIENGMSIVGDTILLSGNDLQGKPQTEVWAPGVDKYELVGGERYLDTFHDHVPKKKGDKSETAENS
ncbi:MAG: hypothetical protein AAF570_26900, partial [Bacteroidota bacterium]